MIFNINIEIIDTVEILFRKEYKISRYRYLMVEADYASQANEIALKHIQSLGYKEFYIASINPIPNKSILDK